MARVLVLRPEPGASATVARARARELDAIAIPLFTIEPVEWQVPDPHGFDGLLITSANAVRHGGSQLGALGGLSVYAVGEATAEAAREAGFTVAATGDEGIDQLLAAIPAELKLLHLCGSDRREPNAPRQTILSVAVYWSPRIEHPDLSAAADTIALIHSPRAGARFAELVEERSSVAIAAISGAAAAAAGSGWKAVQTADAPTDDALLALAARLCNNSQPK